MVPGASQTKSFAVRVLSRSAVSTTEGEKDLQKELFDSGVHSGSVVDPRGRMES
jgi:hypothetical protein